MADETPNSLNDIGRDGISGQFNRYLNEETFSDQQGSETKLDKVRKLRETLKGYNADLAALVNDNAPQARIDKKNNDIQDIEREISDLFSPISFDDKNTDKIRSLFNRNAVIDYARYVGANDINWEHYKRANTNDNASSSDTTTEFTVNNNTITKMNQPVDGDEALNSETLNGLTPQHLVAWSERYPALQLRMQDFAYCKRLGYYPNNRLIILRRFKNAVPDNLFDYHKKNNTSRFEFQQPLATMLTWLKPDQNIARISYKENWIKHEGGIFETIKDSLGGSKSNVSDADTPAYKRIAFGKNTLFDSGILSFGLDATSLERIDGQSFAGNDPYGNPNLIFSAMKRKTGGGGLDSNIRFDLEFEYEMRYIRGVDPGIAMLDLMSNCIRMGTSTSEFRLPLKEINGVGFKDILNGDFEVGFQAFKEGLIDITSNLIDTFSNFVRKSAENVENLVDSFSNANLVDGAVNKVIQHLLSRYREDLKAAISTDTGLESGIWHVTIGNPKVPIISCGDLVVTDNNLELGKELGYNDFPNSFKVEINLSSARERGRDEIERIFNSGRGRVYTYIKPSENYDYDIYNNEPKNNN